MTLMQYVKRIFIFTLTKIQSIACVLGTFWFVWILLLILMKIVVKVSKTQAILWNFCSTASKNPFNTLGKSQFHPLLPILALFHQKTKPGFQKVHTAPNQPSPLYLTWSQYFKTLIYHTVG